MKKELILNYLIETYLNELTPISSGELKRKCELSFSPSTIRNYFQKLDGEGMIVKVHISSGSVPSKEAVQKYWYDNLNFENINILKRNLDRISKKFDVFVTFREKESLILKSILNVDNRFLILDFVQDEIVLKFSEQLFHLFNEVKNYSLDDIKKMLKVLKIEKILDKFSINKVESFNREFLYKHYKEFNIDKLMGDKIFSHFEKGLSFNQDYLAYKIDVKINNKKSEFILLGNIYNNYSEIFNYIKEVK